MWKHQILSSQVNTFRWSVKKISSYNKAERMNKSFLKISIGLQNAYICYAWTIFLIIIMIIVLIKNRDML